jgi:hypothetical protein
MLTIAGSSGYQPIYRLLLTLRSGISCIPLLHSGSLFGCPDVSVVHLRGKLQARQRLFYMSLKRADHDKHERLGVASEGVLEKVGQLCTR